MDEARQRELWKSVGVGALLVRRAAVLGLAALRAAAARLPGRGDAAASGRPRKKSTRHLRLEIETLKSPKRIEALATEQLHLVAPDARRRDRHRTRRAGRAAGQIGGRTAVIDRRRHPSRATRRRRAGSRRPTGARRCSASPSSACSALWVVGIEARLVYLQVFQHADLVARAERQQMRTMRRCRPSAATSSTARAACWRPASTPTRSTPCRRRSTTPRRRSRKLCGALGDCTRRNGRTLAERLGRRSALRLRAAAGVARAGAARRGAEPRRHRLHQGEPPLLSEQGAGGAPARLRRPRQQRARAGSSPPTTRRSRQGRARCSCRPTRGATPSAASSGRRRRLDHRADHRRVPAARRRARAARRRRREPRRGRHAPSSWIRTPARFWRWRTSRRSTRTRIASFDEVDRRNRAVQDLYEPGSTFKVVTASAAIEEKVMPIDDADRHQPRRDPDRHARRRRDDAHNYGVLSFTDVIVKSSNVGAIKIGFSVGTERLSRLRAALRLRPSASRRTFPARARASSGSRTKWTDSALASVSMGYQVGVTPLQMVAAVSSVANGGELIEPRVVRAVVSRQPPLRGAAEGRAADRSAPTPPRR